MLDSATPMHARARAPVRDVDLASAIRALAIDAVEQAISGPPRIPMGMAEIAVALWTTAADAPAITRADIDCRQTA